MQAEAVVVVKVLQYRKNLKLKNTNIKPLQYVEAFLLSSNIKKAEDIVFRFFNISLLIAYG